MMYQTRQEVIEKLLNGETPMADASSGSNSSQDRTSSLRHRQWDDTDAFIQDNLHEVYEKLPNLEKQIWGKLIMMEGNRRTAKAYLRHPVITIDGSDVEFDGLRIGLSRFENPDRMDIVFEIFNEIHQGVKIKIDPDGNVWTKRMCYSPVFLKPLYRNRPNDLFVIDQRPVKVFDIRRFKEILVQELRQAQPDRRRLEKCCLVCLKFSVDHYDLLRTPCWIIVVHLVAIELLNLVLPRDNDLSSPSSSFVASPGSFPAEQSVLYGARQPPGRATRGGVFKRIVRKEDLASHSELQSYGNPRLPPTGYRTDFESRFPGSGPPPPPAPMGGVMATSLVDLRQLNQHYSPIYFNRYNPPRPSRSLAAGMGDRVFSLDGLNDQDKKYAGRPSYIPEPHISDRQMRLKKWKSQDSGIVLGSGSGSYGSK